MKPLASPQPVPAAVCAELRVKFRLLGERSPHGRTIDENDGLAAELPTTDCAMNSDA